jgi:hypothetical protein
MYNNFFVLFIWKKYVFSMLSAKFKSEIKSAKTSQNLLEVDIDILDKKISSQRGKCGRGPKQGKKVAKKCLSKKKKIIIFLDTKKQKKALFDLKVSKQKEEIFDFPKKRPKRSEHKQIKERDF